MDDERLAQLGSIEVPVSALEEPGVSLAALLDEHHAELESPSDDSDAPVDGWRVLPQREDPALVVAAPVDNEWFLGRLADRDGRPRLHLSQKVPRYPSKAERRAGLELRWPDAARDVPIAALFADVVNVSDERWTPLGIDNFRTIGVIEPGRVPSNRRRGHFFGWVADGRTGFILDPGEYARVSVDIPREAIAEAHEGEYSASAVVHSFGLWAAEPLVTTITASDIAAAALRRRARRPPPPSPNGDSTH